MRNQTNAQVEARIKKIEKIVIWLAVLFAGVLILASLAGKN